MEPDPDIVEDVAWYRAELDGCRLEIARLRAHVDRMAERIAQLEARLRR